MKKYQFFVYIITNYRKTVLYTGITNDLSRRLLEHQNQINPNSFTAKYKCHYLLYYEQHQYINNAIAREKEIKRMSRAEKEALISTFNPDWCFLNEGFDSLRE
jgi:putative endonuclease